MMNIEWMCLLKSVGLYLLPALIFVALAAAVYWAGRGIMWVLESIGIGDDAIEAALLVAVTIIALVALVIRPIYAIYQSTCP